MSDNEPGFGERPPRNPFNSGQEVATRPVAALGALASAEQQRALGELQAQIMLARMNPRDQQQAVENILRDCSRITLAKVAQYEYVRGGTDISGPSIKLMEAIARRWGNIHSGFKIVHTEGNTTDVVSYAWDVETGYRDERQFQVRHIRDTRQGPKPVTDERDIYELIANYAQRRKRANLIAVIPSDVIEAAVDQCEDTMHANVDTSVEGLKKLLRAFAEFQVTQAQIEQRIQSRLEAISPGQVTQLSRIYASLKDGMSMPSQWFRAVDPPARPQRQTQQSPAAQTPSKAPAEPAQTQPTSEVKQPKSETRNQVGGAEETPKPEPEAQGEPRPWMESEVDRLARELHEKGEAAETQAEGFAHMVVGVDGEPIDGEVHLDPLAWALTFVNLWQQTAEEERSALIQQNTDALHDCSELSPEADALLDGFIPPPGSTPAEGQEPWADPKPGEPEVDADEQTSATILQHLPTLKSAAEVIEYSKSPTVMVPITRWQKEGRGGLVTSVKGAFTARIANLRAGGA